MQMQPKYVISDASSSWHSGEEDQPQQIQISEDVPKSLIDCRSRRILRGSVGVLVISRVIQLEGKRYV